MANQAKLHSYHTAPQYKYGYEVPHGYNHALELNKCNGNTKWQDSTALEMTQLHEYKMFTLEKELSPLMITRRFESTLSLMSNMMDDIRVGLLQMAT